MARRFDAATTSSVGTSGCAAANSKTRPVADPRLHQSGESDQRRQVVLDHRAECWQAGVDVWEYERTASARDRLTMFTIISWIVQMIPLTSSETLSIVQHHISMPAAPL